MAVIEVNPGICGFITRIETTKIDKKTVEVKIKTECPNIKKINTEIFTVAPLQELFCSLHETQTYRTLVKGIAHPVCLVPSGVLKAVEIAAGLALPKDCHIHITAAAAQT